MRKILIILFLVPLVQSVVSQPIDEIEVRKMKNWQLRGYTQDALKLSEWYQGKILLHEMVQRDSTNAKRKYQLGWCYYQTREFDKALYYFNQLIETKGPWQLSGIYYSALIHKRYGRYELAENMLGVIRRRYQQLPFRMSRWRIDQELSGCNMGIRWRDTIINSEVVRLPDNINDQPMQFAPMMVNDSTFIYGSRSAGVGNFESLDNKVGSEWNRLRVIRTNGKWERNTETEFPDFEDAQQQWSGGVLSSDGERYYQTGSRRNDEGKMESNLYVSYRDGSTWGKPRKLDEGVNRRGYSSSQLTLGTCFDVNKEVIYFVSDRPGGVGGKDIWYALYDKKKGVYNRAENAGIYLNTIADEMTPYYDLPTHSLYFSSDGWMGLGGLDVFRTRGELVSWDMPENIGIPVNTGSDDLSFVISASGNQGLLASNRHSDKSIKQNCCDELYEYRTTKSPRVLVRGRLQREQLQGEDFLKSLRGEMLPEKGTQNLNFQNIRIQQLADTLSVVNILETKTNELGEFEVWVEANNQYRIVVDDSTLMGEDIEFNTHVPSANSVVQLTPVTLMEIPEEAIEVKNIVYDFDKVELTNEAKQIVDSTLLQILIKYPHLRVEIGSHTDNKGDERYNDRLSQRRAYRVIEYLSEKGISMKRMTAVGYGERKPVAPNEMSDGKDDPIGRQKNRRTEFKIIGSDFYKQ